MKPQKSKSNSQTFLSGRLGGGGVLEYLVFLKHSFLYLYFPYRQSVLSLPANSPKLCGAKHHLQGHIEMDEGSQMQHARTQSLSKYQQQ